MAVTAYAHMFMQDVASRLANRIQLTTDGHGPYLGAVEDAFGADIDYAILIKHYGTPDGALGHRSLPRSRSRDRPASSRAFATSAISRIARAASSSTSLSALLPPVSVPPVAVSLRCDDGVGSSAVCSGLSSL